MRMRTVNVRPSTLQNISASHQFCEVIRLCRSSSLSGICTSHDSSSPFGSRAQHGERVSSQASHSAGPALDTSNKSSAAGQRRRSRELDHVARWRRGNEDVVCELFVRSC